MSVDLWPPAFPLGRRLSVLVGPGRLLSRFARPRAFRHGLRFRDVLGVTAFRAPFAADPVIARRGSPGPRASLRPARLGAEPLTSPKEDHHDVVSRL
jgi:hypothetical protein